SRTPSSTSPASGRGGGSRTPSTTSPASGRGGATRGRGTTRSQQSGLRREGSSQATTQSGLTTAQPTQASQHPSAAGPSAQPTQASQHPSAAVGSAQPIQPGSTKTTQPAQPRRITSRQAAAPTRAIHATTNKKKSLGLATRSRRDGQLRPWAGSVRDPNSKGKFVFDLTGNPAGPPPIPGGGPVCAWGPPRAGGITFRVAPPDFDIQKRQEADADKPPPAFEGNRGMEKGKEEVNDNKDKGKKKIWQP
ncbi:hypothetical protein SLA2020_441880, partial [Shorea laevis]